MRSIHALTAAVSCAHRVAGGADVARILLQMYPKLRL
jgi:hypothetical protein